MMQVCAADWSSSVSPTVLTFLDLERRSGQILVVTHDHVGRVWLRGGSVISGAHRGIAPREPGGDL